MFVVSFVKKDCKNIIGAKFDANVRIVILAWF